MKVYKCIVTGDELFTEVHKVEQVGNIYKVKGKHVTRSADGVDDKLIGGNASAEDPQEAAADGDSISGIDVVLDSRLKETGFGKKKDFLAYFKGYIAEIQKRLTEKNPDLDVDDFKKRNQEAFKKLIESFSDYEFYTGESLDPDGTIAMVKWEDETPYLYFLADGVVAEKF